MQDFLHRSYNRLPEASKKEQIATDLLIEVRSFIKHTKLKSADFVLLNRLIDIIEQGNQPNKVLRSMQNRFIKIQQEYQK